MCLTFPFRVKRVQPPFAVVERGRTKRTVRIDPLKKLRAGDWVLVQADLALRTVTAREAKSILSYLPKP